MMVEVVEIMVEEDISQLIFLFFFLFLSFLDFSPSFFLCFVSKILENLRRIYMK